uniref:Isopentenyltransferase n=1 Tax=Cucumis sativus TaxID=3659 RepID=F2X313_CUCSA|nr:isopentenyltransferase [Cucumis sativus]
MRMALSLTSAAGKQVQPLVGNFQGNFNMEQFFRRKDKVVVVMGATGTGKSRLAIELATRFPSEIVNSDKIQVYEGLDVVTNKVTEEERRGIPHHLLSSIDPKSNFSSRDFTHHASGAIESILARDRLPIIAGGSNSYIEALVNDYAEARFRYEFCFLWVDVSLPILQKFVSDRVDRMVDGGFVEEVRQIFDPEGDYSQGIKRAIGVPELHEFLRAERDGADERVLNILLELGDFKKLKDNTCRLAFPSTREGIRLSFEEKGIWKSSGESDGPREVILDRTVKNSPGRLGKKVRPSKPGSRDRRPNFPWDRNPPIPPPEFPPPEGGGRGRPAVSP